MPLKDGYGVLKCKLADEEPVFMLGDHNNHVEVLVEGESNVKYRLAINIKSNRSPNQVLYFVGEDFRSEEITELPQLDFGFNEITDENRNIALDYIRGNLVIPKNMISLPNIDRDIEDIDPNNDLYDKITSYISEARGTKATFYVFGEPFGPERQRDKYFGFTPGRGIHNIHMNQGNVGDRNLEEENGSWQDGGVLIHFENENRWVAIFLAFQSQSWCTDDAGRAVKPVSECDHNSCEANREAVPGVPC